MMSSLALLHLRPQIFFLFFHLLKTRWFILLFLDFIFSSNSVQAPRHFRSIFVKLETFHFFACHCFRPTTSIQYILFGFHSSYTSLL